MNCPDSAGDISVYGIITSISYILIGLLGLVVNNSFLNETNSTLIISGIGAIFSFSNVDDMIYKRAIITCSCTLLYKLVSEVIKKWMSLKYVPSDTILGERYYRLPIALFSLMMSLFSAVAVKFYSNYFLVAILLLLQLITIITVIKFFPRGTYLYSITRKMSLRTFISTILSCVGLITSIYCLPSVYGWLDLFIGAPIANISIPYTLYTTSQLILLIRGKNLHRTIDVRGTDMIYIAYYIGRDISVSQEEEP